jgi:hypothetical protein
MRVALLASLLRMSTEFQGVQLDRIGKPQFHNTHLMSTSCKSHSQAACDPALAWDPRQQFWYVTDSRSGERRRGKSLRSHACKMP